MPSRAKELVKNKFPISCTFGNGAIVPLGQMIVKDNFHVVFEVRGVFASSVIYLLQEPHGYTQTGRGLRPFDELSRDIHGMEDHALARMRDVREHSVFNRIVFGTIGGIMGHPNLQAQPVGERLEVFFKQVVRGAVTTATVSKYQQPFRVGIGRSSRVLPPQRYTVTTELARIVARIQMDVRVLMDHVIHPVGNQLPVARRPEIMVESFDSLRGQGCARPMKIPE